MKRLAAAAAAAALALSLPALATARPIDERPARHGDVEIIDNSFDPFDLTVQPGKTVVWAHEGANPHTVSADDGSFESGTMINGQTFEHTFTTVGSFSYICRVHAGMAGVINVVAPTGPQPTTIDALGATVAGTTIGVTGSATFNGESPVLIAEDFIGDAPLAGNVPPEETGVDLTGGYISQPDATTPELVFEFDVTGLPDTGSLPEVIRYGFPFTVGTGNFMIQAKFTNLVATTTVDDPAGHATHAGASFQLRGNCGVLVAINNCGHVGWLEGEWDVEDSAVRVTMPLGSSLAPQLVPGATIAENPDSLGGDIVASYQAYVSTAETQDSAVWEEGTTYTVPARTVRLGIVPAGAPAQFTVDGTVAANGSDFSGSLTTEGLAPGDHDVWVEACFGTNCDAQKVTITI